MAYRCKELGNMKSYSRHPFPRQMFSSSIRPIYYDKNTGDNELYRETKPVLWFVRIMGLLPYVMTSSGTMAFKMFSPVTLYSVIIVFCTIALSYLIQADVLKLLEKDSTSTFGDSLLNVTGIVFLTPVYLVPLTHWVEIRKKVTYVNSWKIFQMDYRNVTGRIIKYNLTRKVFVLLSLVAIINVCTVCFLLFLPQRVEAWKMFPALYAQSQCVILSATWGIICIALVKTARNLFEDLEKQVKNSGYNQYHIRRYKVLWLALSRLTQDLGNSMGLTYGGQTLIYFTLQVMCSFSFFFNYGQNKIMVGFTAFLTVVWGTLIFVQCNCAQLATDEVGSKFMNKLESLDYTVPHAYTEIHSEIHNFLNTIKRYKPEISFCGFVTVNRTLQTALMSTMVTYMVVLLQFQGTTEKEKSHDETNSSSK